MANIYSYERSCYVDAQRAAVAAAGADGHIINLHWSTGDGCYEVLPSESEAISVLVGWSTKEGRPIGDAQRLCGYPRTRGVDLTKEGCNDSYVVYCHYLRP